MIRAVKAKTILYAVDHSYPFSSDGYSIRTTAVAEALTELGHRVVVVNRPGRLWSRKGFDASQVKTQYRKNRVSYLYFQDDGFPYSELYTIYKPDMVIAASNHANAIPALRSARNAGIHCIYEVRGFWEFTRAYKDQKYANSQQFLDDKSNEAKAACLADEVWTLNAIMQDELAARGVPAEKIALLPNSLTSMPELQNKTDYLHELVGSRPDDITLAYIGSFNHYEGLELLIDAVVKLGLEQPLKVVFIGSGASQGVDAAGDVDPVTEALKTYAKRKQVGDRIFFTGRLDKETIQRCYADIDIVVNPRLPSPVTNTVSSLKSIEAMAFAKPLILSDIPPHKLLANESSQPIPLFTAGNAESLASEIKRVVQQIENHRAIALEQRAWVDEHRVFSKSFILNQLSLI